MTSTIRNIFALVLLLLTVVAPLRAQQPTVSVRMDSTYVTFGCPMTFHLEAVVPDGQQILFPQDVLRQGGIVAYDDSAQYLLELDDFEAPHVDTVQTANGLTTLAEDITVYAFDSATLFIPPFEFVTSVGDTLRTNSLALKVFVPFEGVEVDPEKFAGFKDVEDPEFVLLDYIWYFLWPLITLAILAAAWFGWKYYKRQQSNKPVEVVKAKPIPPHIVAMEALQALADKKLWQNGRDKQYHTELTDILRLYIERRFEVPAMEKTSDEILEELYELAESQKASLTNLKQILSIADLVKFAKYQPLADENQLSFLNAKMFVEQTKKIELEVTEEKEKPSFSRTLDWESDDRSAAPDNDNDTSIEID